MTARAMTVLAERWLDEMILQGSVDNIDGEIADTWTVPTVLGDVAIMEIMAYVSPLATAMANPELKGVRFTVTDSVGTVKDIIGVGRWSNTGTARLSTYVSPDPLVLLRADDSINVLFDEVDTNVTPTADFRMWVKCVRLTPTARGAAGSLRLVR